MTSNKGKLPGTTGRFIARTANLIALASCMSLSIPSWAGDSGDVNITSISVSKIEVEANGGKYTKMKNSQNLNIQASLALDAGVSGRVQSWRVTPKLKVPHATYSVFTISAVAQEYEAFKRPKTVSKTINLAINTIPLGAYAVEACNKKAVQLRSTGKTDDWIFSNEHSFNADVALGLEYSMSGIAGIQVPSEVKTPTQFQIVCKSQPARVPSEPNPTRDVPDVLSSSLSILESATLGGDCRLKLSGVIKTSSPNTTVQFRYEDNKGVKSNLKTAKSDHVNMAMFNHEFPLPGTGLKTGKIRIIGKGGKFKSAWQNYSVTCSANAPGNFSSNAPPAVEMSVTPATYKNVNGHNCIDKLWLTGVITGKGNQAGRARFTGNSYMSGYEDYSVTNGTKKTILIAYTFNWGAVPANGFVSKDLFLTFNVENENQAVIAATPLKKYSFTCGSVKAEIAPGAFPQKPVKVNPIGAQAPTRLKN